MCRNVIQERFTTQFDSMQEWGQTIIISSLQRIAQIMDANKEAVWQWFDTKKQSNAVGGSR
jgi:hypothetical protein